VRSRNRGLESSGRLLDGALLRFKRFYLCNWQVYSAGPSGLGIARRSASSAGW